MSEFSSKLLRALEHVCDEVIRNEEVLSDLDRKIGDGDHGANMKRGCMAIKQIIPELSGADVPFIANKCAMLLLSKVGGASGPLLASGLLKVAKELPKDESELIAKPNFWFLQFLLSFTNGIKERGKAEIGDKTFIDYLQPFCDQFAKELESFPDSNLKQLIDKSRIFGEQGRDCTIKIAAKKGRASYLGDRSIGTADPGATTVSIVFKAVSEAL